MSNHTNLKCYHINNIENPSNNQQHLATMPFKSLTDHHAILPSNLCQHNTTKVDMKIGFLVLFTIKVFQAAVAQGLTN